MMQKTHSTGGSLAQSYKTRQYTTLVHQANNSQWTYVLGDTEHGLVAAAAMQNRLRGGRGSSALACRIWVEHLPTNRSASQ